MLDVPRGAIAIPTPIEKDMSDIPEKEGRGLTSVGIDLGHNLSWKELAVDQARSLHIDVEELEKFLKYPEFDQNNSMKRDAFTIALEFSRKKLREIHDDDEDEDTDNDDDDIDEDSFDDGTPYSKASRKKRNKCPLNDLDLVDFFKHLRQNVLFDIEFTVKPSLTNQKYRKYCWCPCGSKMKPWRTYFAIECIDCNSNKSFTPEGLIGHVKQKSKHCPLHVGILHYLKNLHQMQVDYNSNLKIQKKFGQKLFKVRK